MRLDTRRFYAEKIGELVTDRLMENFDNLMDYRFTANMEEELDKVAHGQAQWDAVLNEFYGDFSGKLVTAKDVENGMRDNAPTDTDIICPQPDCGRHMQIRNGSTGVSRLLGYGLKPKERCTKTINLIPGEEAVDVDQDEEGESKLLRKMRKCSKCQSAMLSYLVDETRKLHICGNNPDCSAIEIETGTFKIKGYDGPLLECDKCGAEMQLKSGRFGKYFGCVECPNTRKLLRNGEPAPPKATRCPCLSCSAKKLKTTETARLGFLAASQFRNTGKPVRRWSQKSNLTPMNWTRNSATRWRRLKDPDGNPAVIRYSRKTKE